MRAVLRRLHSPDVDDLETWAPESGACFGVLVQAFVGPQNGKGEESFDFTVCSPEWLARRHGRNAAVLGRHHLLLFDYDFDEVRRAIESVINSAEGQNWQEIASKIARHGKWEFEDYNPDS
ncbi:MAG: immunity 8 family protein [Deltaproteobacteria bacterium]|nr:immunity 8 family protein [Deltaproteobacteria bacterium]